MRKKKNTSQHRSIETLRTEAAKFLAVRKYKEAIDAYKQLLKKENNAEWQRALIHTYLLWAQAVAHKGMYKEAVVLWENRAKLCADKKGFDQYLFWMSYAHYDGRAARLFIDNPEHVTRQLYVHFGALLLSGKTELAQIFPEDSELHTQYVLIKSAIQAYSQGKETAPYLKKITFRSPYRDMRTILKTLCTIDKEPQTALQLLDKLDAESPYLQFAELIRMSVQQGSDMLSSMSKLGIPEKNFIAKLKGWDKTQLKVIAMLQTTAKREGTPKALLEVIIANRPVLGDQYSQQFCHALLPSYTTGLKMYERVFGSLSDFEKNRIAALNSERHENFLKAEKYWRLCIANILAHTPLQAALILRHLVENAEKCETEDEYDVPEDLTESLRLDPDDKESYLKLIAWYADDKRSYQKWVEAAIKHFPKDSETLLIAMDAAMGKKAFKKAVKFAKILLKVDPINTQARNVARTCHIAHARKLIKTKKYELARKELTQAGLFEKTHQRNGVVQINQALLELQAEGMMIPLLKKQTAAQRKRATPIQINTYIHDLFEEALSLDQSSIRGHFRLIVEIKRQNLDPYQIRPLLSPIKKGYIPTRREILELMTLINAYFANQITCMADTLDDLKLYFQKALKLEFSQEEMLSICLCLKKVGHKLFLKKFAERALKRWSNEPAFIYYQIYAKTKENIYHVSMKDFERLQNALDEAEEQGDHRTMVMIMDLLNQIGRHSLFGNMENDLDPATIIKILSNL